MIVAQRSVCFVRENEVNLTIAKDSITQIIQFVKYSDLTIAKETITQICKILNY